MSQISSSSGLVSGINYADIIDKLIAVESRPKQRIKTDNAQVKAKQQAFNDINAKLLSLKLSAGGLSDHNAFDQATATSSDESVLTASAGTGATTGNYRFRVQQLVSGQQTLTDGFVDREATPVAPQGALLKFERGQARLDTKTDLSQLNGGAGISRGNIRIQDRTGASTTVDLSSVVSVDEVLTRINNAAAVNVTASVDGDRLVVDDASGGDTSPLTISDVGTTATATSLGIAGTSGSGQIEGEQINRLGSDSVLAQLNDGNGVGISAGGDDLQITTGGGDSFAVNLQGAVTLGDVIEKIETATQGAVAGSTTPDGQGLRLSDATGGGAGFTVSAVGQSTAAEDLGLVANDSDGDANINGRRLQAGINSKLLRNLNGGHGLTAFGGEAFTPLREQTALTDLLGGNGLSTDGTTNADIEIQARDSDTNFNIDLDSLTTVGELQDAVSTQTGGRVALFVEGQTLVAGDSTGGSGNLVIQNSVGSTAASDIGLAVDGPTNTVQGTALNPAGTATSGATIQITNRAGNSGTVDLSGSISVSDLVGTINGANLGVSASLNSAGNGLRITDNTSGTGDLQITDDSGVLGAQLGLTGTHTNGVAEGADLQVQYVTESTTLDSLGVSAGKFIIRDSGGAQANVDLTQGNERTIGDVISEINSRGLQLNARINDTGDGIVLEDTGPGSRAIEVTEDGGTTAAELGLLGSAGSAGQDLHARLETRVVVGQNDSLQDLTNKIHNAGAGLNAGIINDGSAGAPFRLSLSSREGGADSGFVFDDGGLGLNARNLAEARDAVVFFGSSDPANALAITSQTNELDNVIPGATVNLKSTSDQPVQVNVSDDNESLVGDLQKFTENFNKVVDTLDKYDSYNQETKERGVLLGNGTVLRTRGSLYNAVTNANPELAGRYDSLSQVGITIGSGAKLQFDEDQFRQALQTDPQAVEQLFTFENFEVDPETGEQSDQLISQGVVKEIDKLLERLTQAEGGTIQDAVDNLDQQVELNNDRIDSIDTRIQAKRQRLQDQFNNLERSLADLQSQQSALAGLSAAAPQSLISSI